MTFDDLRLASDPLRPMVELIMRKWTGPARLYDGVILLRLRDEVARITPRFEGEYLPVRFALIRLSRYINAALEQKNPGDLARKFKAFEFVCEVYRDPPEL